MRRGRGEGRGKGGGGRGGGEEEEKLGGDWGQGIRKGGKGQNTSYGILKESNSETFQCALLRD